MSKKKTGEFEMTGDEIRLWTEANVTAKLAAHYEQQAREYKERAERSAFGFWSLIRRTRDLPVDGVISIKRDSLLLIVSDKKKAEELRSSMAKRAAVIASEK